MWPFICQFIEKLFRETIEPAVRGANTHLSTFSFTKVDMGQQVSSSFCPLPCVQDFLYSRMLSEYKNTLSHTFWRKPHVLEEATAVRAAWCVCGVCSSGSALGWSFFMLQGPRLPPFVEPFWPALSSWPAFFLTFPGSPVVCPATLYSTGVTFSSLSC